MSKLQMEPLSQGVLANLTVEELEQRLEMQVLRLPEAAWGCDVDCGTYCPQQCTALCPDGNCTTYCTDTLCGTLCTDGNCTSLCTDSYCSTGYCDTILFC